MEESATVSGAAAGVGAGRPHPGRPVCRAVEILLLVLPSAHLLWVPVAGAVATAADVALGLVVLVWAVELVGPGGNGGGVLPALRGEDVPGLPGRRVLLALGLLAAYGVWVGLSGLWGFHAGYAVAKGVGTVALAAAAAAVATSGLPVGRAVDAWLGGVAVALATTLVLAVAGPDILQSRVLYTGGGVQGLPFPRPSGPLLHPNMLGDLLVVSCLLAWGRWPSLGDRGRRWVGALAVAMVVTLALSVSAAWLPAGIAAGWIARADRKAGRGSRARSASLRLGGTVLAGVTLAGLVVPLRLDLGFVEVATAAVRPDIWAGAVEAVLTAPLLGVGASPYLAEVPDPLLGGTPVLWDAHNAYLSVLGQYGVVGAALAGLGVAWVVLGALARVPRGRLRTALVVALVAVAVDAVFMASEDLRHVWMLLGLCGLAGAMPPDGDPAVAAVRKAA